MSEWAQFGLVILSAIFAAGGAWAGATVKIEWLRADLANLREDFRAHLREAHRHD